MNRDAMTAITGKDVSRFCCPVCRRTLKLEEDAIRCTGCGRRYPIVDGIPVLLRDRAMLTGNEL